MHKTVCMCSLGGGNAGEGTGKRLVDVVSRSMEMLGLLAPAKLVVEAAVTRHTAGFRVGGGVIGTVGNDKSA
jgi:hypothetical protein